MPAGSNPPNLPVHSWIPTGSPDRRGNCDDLRWEALCKNHPSSPQCTNSFPGFHSVKVIKLLPLHLPLASLHALLTTIHQHVPDVPRPVPEMQCGRHGTGCPLSCGLIVVCTNHDTKHHQPSQSIASLIPNVRGQYGIEAQKKLVWPWVVFSICHVLPAGHERVSPES